MLTYQETSKVRESGYSLEDTNFDERVRSEVFGDDLTLSQPDASHECEEVLIDDHRANFGPAELVEHKLSTLLGGAWQPVSHMGIQPLQGSRSHC
jgi:hypothetical protein